MGGWRVGNLITITQEVLQTELQGVHSLRCIRWGRGRGGGAGGRRRGRS